MDAQLAYQQELEYQEWLETDGVEVANSELQVLRNEELELNSVDFFV